MPGHLRGLVEWPRRVSGYPFTRFLGQKGAENEGDVGLSVYFADEAFRGGGGGAADTAEF